MTLEEYKVYLGKFLRNYLKKSHCDGYVLGVSGGIDSAVVGGLLSTYFKNQSIVLIMPIGNQEGINDAIKVCKDFKLNSKIVDLTDSYNSLLMSCDLPNSPLAKGNLKARLRMATLYYYARINNYLVIGTDNKDEYYTGFFTKYGDGGYDINPLRYLTKRQVREMAKLLKVDESIINKKPTPGLINGVNDEDELKVSYEEIDNFLDNKEVSLEAKERIEYLHKISKHKRELPAFPKDFK